jgi:predicted ATP-grasp superfamily ATP-dependent carboligase
VFDLVPGPDDRLYVHCTYVDARGVAQPGMTVRKLRQSPPSFGVARVAEIVDDIPELRDATQALLRQLDFRSGIAAVEFKHDPRDGRFRFIEVNGRSILCNALLHRAGLDLAGLAWSEHATGRRERQQPSSWRGVWVNLHADLLYSAIRNDERLGFAEFAAPYRRPLVEAVWSARDPWPFLAQWGRSALLGAQAVVRPERRRWLRAASVLAPRT